MSSPRPCFVWLRFPAADNVNKRCDVGRQVMTISIHNKCRLFHTILHSFHLVPASLQTFVLIFFYLTRDSLLDGLVTLGYIVTDITNRQRVSACSIPLIYGHNSCLSPTPVKPRCSTDIVIGTLAKEYTGQQSNQNRSKATQGVCLQTWPITSKFVGHYPHHTGNDFGHTHIGCFEHQQHPRVPRPTEGDGASSSSNGATPMVNGR